MYINMQVYQVLIYENMSGWVDSTSLHKMEKLEIEITEEKCTGCYPTPIGELYLGFTSVCFNFGGFFITPLN